MIGPHEGARARWAGADCRTRPVGRISRPVSTFGERALAPTPQWPLTAEQTEVVAQPADSELLVLAGPGTGKTHTLVARLARLLAEYDDPRDVLVLSFTRVVVREIHLRLGSSEPALAYLRPFTFDSFATRLLSTVRELEEFRDWSNGSFEARIEAATAALAEVPEASEWLTDRYRHVIVDEIQDLVGRRANLVTRLLDVMPAFTLLGDPAQGIYGWQQDGVRPSTDEFIGHLRGSRPELRTLALTIDHRTRTAEARVASGHRSALERRVTAQCELGPMRDVLRDLEPLGRIESAVRIIPSLPTPLAILTRTNAEALTISEALYSNGVDHVVRRRATDRAAAPWIADVARGRRRFLTENAFREEYERSGLSTGLDVEDAWDLLSSTGDDDRQVDLLTVAESLRRGRLPDELTAPQDASIVVSTVHRAKGLEFAAVVVAEPAAWRYAKCDEVEEARILFVAMTRPRDHLFQMATIDTDGWRLDQRSDRWVKALPGKEWATLGFEVRGDDLHFMHPAGTWGIRADALALQERLLSRVRRGDQVYLKQLEAVDDGDRQVMYAVIHRGDEIGVTSDRFADQLGRRLHSARRPARWPLRVDALRVEGLDSVSGLEGVGTDTGLGNSGLWLRPRLAGLGKVHWPEKGSA